VGVVLALACQPSAADHEQLGDRWYGTGAYRDALAEYQLGLKAHPGDPDLEAKVGAAALHVGDYATAVSAYIALGEGDRSRAGEAADGLEAEQMIDELRPDVALLDVKMPGLSGLELCERIARRALPTRVLMISAYLDPNLVARALAAGAAGYLGKDASRDEICEALVQVGLGVVPA
jgi:CheY-like chemotaxis protein